MDQNDEICAFVIEGRHVCFRCYDPNTDKEEDILTGQAVANTCDCRCDRCREIIHPYQPESQPLHLGNSCYQ